MLEFRSQDLEFRMLGVIVFLSLGIYSPLKIIDKDAALLVTKKLCIKPISEDLVHEAITFNQKMYHRINLCSFCTDKKNQKPLPLRLFSRQLACA